MREIDVESWAQFEEQLQNIQEDHLRRMNSVHTHVPALLYRGQGNSKWALETTLERQLICALGNVNQSMTFSNYFRLISRVKSQLESVTSNRWDMRIFSEYETWAKERDISLMLNDLAKSVSEYGYMTYLRHHGFPSPLLDWSRSPYIAAYFAFSGIAKTVPDKRPKNVSIYVYCQSQDGIKVHTHSFDIPYLHTFGPYIQTHQRHFLQQSQYTVCISLSKELDEWQYVCHEKVLSPNNSHQDILWKFNIPSNEYLQVLKRLDSFNLNAYSLFSSDENLMETLAMRELHFMGKER